ncbi:hypothetical protein [Arthrobacter sp. NA-172]|uniref:hypothetical protein n=1 Tax=Arthrobacter sp. NA-172 TaxID=3367524 RepID=UPI003753F9DF
MKALRKSAKSRKARAARTSASEGSTTDASTAVKPKPLWARPLVWLAGVVVAALGIAITNMLVPIFGNVLGNLTQTGDPVRVDFVQISDVGGRSYAFPGTVQFTGQQVDQLNSQSPEAQHGWLESKGGVSPGIMYIQLTLSGNRSEGVRILNLKPVSECSQPPYSGTVFESPPAFLEVSLLVSLHLDDPDPSAMYFPSGASGERPYFLDNSIFLQKDQQQVMVVQIETKKSLCSVGLELSVLDSGKTVVQKVDNHGAPFRVTAELGRTAWQHVYLGGSICPSYVPASASWLRGEKGNPCGVP